jgi:predicted transposase YdaD
LTALADLAFGVGDPVEEIYHLDAQSAAKESLHRDVLLYNVLLHRQYAVPVTTILLLLRPQAQHRNVTGTVVYEGRTGQGKMEFGYHIVRMWEQPVEAFLQGPLGTLPLAVLARLPQELSLAEGLGRVIEQLVERLEREGTPEQRARLAMSAYLLTGARVPRDLAKDLFKRVPYMHESDTYQAILEEGRQEGRQEGGLTKLRETLLRQGRKCFGEPSEQQREALLAINNMERLDRMSERLFDVESWDAFLQVW